MSYSPFWLFILSIILYRKRWTRFLHATLPLDLFIPKEFAAIFIYRQWGFVIKYAYDEDGFSRELKALQALDSLDRAPSLIAYGYASTSIPFLVMTYQGETIPHIDTPTA